MDDARIVNTPYESSNQSPIAPAAISAASPSPPHHPAAEVSHHRWPPTALAAAHWGHPKAQGVAWGASGWAPVVERWCCPGEAEPGEPAMDPRVRPMRRRYQPGD